MVQKQLGPNIWGRAGETFWGRLYNLSTNLEEILSHANGKFNYCIIIIIIINAYYNYIIKLYCKYYIYTKGLRKECGKEENMAVNGGRYYFLFQKKTVKCSVHCHVFA